jgi:hypothetical protein
MASLLALTVLLAAKPAAADSGTGATQPELLVGPVLGAQLTSRQVGAVDLGPGASNVGLAALLAIDGGSLLLGLDAAYVPLVQGAIGDEAVDAHGAWAALSLGHALRAGDHRLGAALLAAVDARWSHLSRGDSSHDTRVDAGLRLLYDHHVGEHLALGLRADGLVFSGPTVRVLASLGVRL